MKSRLVRAALFSVVFLAAVLVAFPFVFGPSVDDPSFRFPDNPFTLEVRISNRNVTPFTNLDYSCFATEMVLANGSSLPDVKVVTQGHVKRLRGRNPIVVRCETAYIIIAPIKSGTFKLTLKYHTYPWDREFTREYYFNATVDAKGQITGWSRK